MSMAGSAMDGRSLYATCEDYQSDYSVDGPFKRRAEDAEPAMKRERLPKARIYDSSLHTTDAGSSSGSSKNSKDSGYHSDPDALHPGLVSLVPAAPAPGPGPVAPSRRHITLEDASSPPSSPAARRRPQPRDSGLEYKTSKDGEIRLRMDGSDPVSLSFNGEMEGRNLEIVPLDDGTASIIIGNSRSHKTYHRSYDRPAKEYHTRKRRERVQDCTDPNCTDCPAKRQPIPRVLQESGPLYQPAIPPASPRRRNQSISIHQVPHNQPPQMPPPWYNGYPPQHHLMQPYPTYHAGYPGPPPFNAFNATPAHSPYGLPGLPAPHTLPTPPYSHSSPRSPKTHRAQSLTRKPLSPPQDAPSPPFPTQTQTQNFPSARYPPRPPKTPQPHPNPRPSPSPSSSESESESEPEPELPLERHRRTAITRAPPTHRTPISYPAPPPKIIISNPNPATKQPDPSSSSSADRNVRSDSGYSSSHRDSMSYRVSPAGRSSASYYYSQPEILPRSQGREGGVWYDYLGSVGGEGEVERERERERGREGEGERGGRRRRGGVVYSEARRVVVEDPRVVDLYKEREERRREDREERRREELEERRRREEREERRREQRRERRREEEEMEGAREEALMAAERVKVGKIKAEVKAAKARAVEEARVREEEERVRAGAGKVQVIKDKPSPREERALVRRNEDWRESLKAGVSGMQGQRRRKEDEGVDWEKRAVELKQRLDEKIKRKDEDISEHDLVGSKKIMSKPALKMLPPPEAERKEPVTVVQRYQNSSELIDPTVTLRRPRHLIFEDSKELPITIPLEKKPILLSAVEKHVFPATELLVPSGNPSLPQKASSNDGLTNVDENLGTSSPLNERSDLIDEMQALTLKQAEKATEPPLIPSSVEKDHGETNPPHRLSQHPHSLRTHGQDSNDDSCEQKEDSEEESFAKSTEQDDESDSAQCEVSVKTALDTAMNVVKHLLLRDLLDQTLLEASDSPEGSGASSNRSNTSRAGSSATSSRSSPATDKSQGRKRVRGTGRDPNGGGGDDSDENGDDRPKKKNSGKGPPHQFPRRRLKCPFYQRQPEKYTKNACRGEGFADMAKLKDHIKRVHTQPLRCSRCWVEMKSDDAYSEHLQREKVCEKKAAPADDRILPRTLKKLDFKKAPYANARNMDEKWKMMYGVLFPQDTEIPSPYDQQGMSPRLERALSEALEEELTRELAPILEPIMSRIKERIPAIIERCQQKLLGMSASEEEVVYTPSSAMSMLSSSDGEPGKAKHARHGSSNTSRCSGSSFEVVPTAERVSSKSKGKQPQRVSPSIARMSSGASNGDGHEVSSPGSSTGYSMVYADGAGESQYLDASVPELCDGTKLCAPDPLTQDASFPCAKDIDMQTGQSETAAPVQSFHPNDMQLYSSDPPNWAPGQEWTTEMNDQATQDWDAIMKEFDFSGIS